MGTFRGVEDKQKKQPYTQNISPNRQPSLNFSTYRHVNFRIVRTNSGERPLSPEEEENFKSRLSKIWEGMKTPSVTPKWKDIISNKSTDLWLSQIAEHIPTNVKLILASPHPPTPAQLKSLPWSNTTDGGVFAWCSEANGKQDSTKKTFYVYIGSASKGDGGLNFRKSHMLSPSATPHDEGLKRKIKDLGLNAEGEFKTLSIVPFENGFDGKVTDVRALAILTRWALTIWLGAVDEGLKPKVKELVPWDLENIEYFGLVGDNPLETDFNGSDKATKGEN